MRQFRFPSCTAALALVPIALVLTACKAGSADADPHAAAVTTAITAVPATSTTATTTTTTAPVLPTTTTARPPRPTTTVAVPRTVLDTGFKPFLIAGGDVTLTYPTPRVERVGFHESKLLGARDLVVMAGAGETLDMPTRGRQTPGRTAADILSEPDREVRVPVTGRVIRGGTYTLYCKYTDSFAVIEPDSHPGWEVKILHISGLAVNVGQRVEAGVTPLAARPTRLPFKSQVEDYSAAPAWPHVQIEVDDPTIKNPPGVGGGGCT